MILVDNVKFMYSLYGPPVIVIYVAAFFFGATIASGCTCAAYRIVHGESWVRGRSHCEHCGHRLSWWELIPLFSCLALRGRCHNCGKKFGYTHAIVEGSVGTVWAVMAMLYPALPNILIIMPMIASSLTGLVFAFAYYSAFRKSH